MHPLEAEPSLLVGLGRLPPDDPELLGGEARHGEPVLDEQLRLRLALRPVRLAIGQRDAPGHQVPVVRTQVRDVRHRHEEIAPDEADLVLDVALLVAAAGVAKREVEPVVRRERSEQLRRPEPVRHLPADAGRVVEHDACRHAADELEGVLEALADALGVLPPEHLREPDVGERERDDKVEQAGPHAVQVEVGLAEVCLGLAGGPHERQERRGRRHALLADPCDVMADGRFRRLATVLVAQALVDPLRRVPLLAPAARVLLEVALDDRAVLVHDRLRRLLHRHREREVVSLQVLVDRVARDAHLAADPGDRLALLLELSYSLDLGHADRHPLRPPLLNTKATTKIGPLVGGQRVLYAEVSIIDMPRCRLLRYRNYLAPRVESYTVL